MKLENTMPSRKSVVALVIALALLVYLQPAGSQTNVSGGSAVTLLDSGGSNKASISASGALKVDPSAVTSPVSIASAVTVNNATAANLKVDLSGTAANSTALKVDPSAVTSPVSLAALPALVAGTATIGKVLNAANTCNSTPVDSGIVTNIATGSGTDLETSATCVYTLYIANTTSSAVTVTIKDKAGTPNTYSNAFSLGPNSDVLRLFGGIKFTGGVTIVAGTSSAINAQLVGVQ